jgi:hypothetical protein
MNTLKKFTPKFGTKADMNRMKRIYRVFDYAMEVNPQESEGVHHIRKEMDARRPRVLTGEEANFIIKVCYDGGISLKRQLQELLHGYKPTRKPWWRGHYEKKIEEARQRYELERTESNLTNSQIDRSAANRGASSERESQLQ